MLITSTVRAAGESCTRDGWEQEREGSHARVCAALGNMPPLFSLPCNLSHYLAPCLLSCNHPEADSLEGIPQCKHLLGNRNKLPMVALAIGGAVFCNEAEVCLLLKVLAYTVQTFPWSRSDIPGKNSLPFLSV